MVDLNRTPIFDGEWQGLQLRMDTPKTCVTMRLDYVLTLLLTILGPIHIHI